MTAALLDALLRRSSGTFVRAARSRGLRARAAKTLEAAAHEVSPEDPRRILDSRELFEAAATRAVVGDGGNLELSFSLVDELANTVETLGLARSSDVPDPFRRVWVSGGGGQRVRGVVLTRRAGELAVFCPPTQRVITEIGGVVWLRYRGFSSSVEYDLQLDDAVRLPGAHVLHLKRRSGQGAIGRARVRYATSLKGSVRLLDGAEDPDASRALPCVVTDISAGGLALDCPTLLENGARVRVEFQLRDDLDTPFSAEAVVRWSRENPEGLHGGGLAFSDLPRPRFERLERYLRALSEDAPSEASTDAQAPRPAPMEQGPEAEPRVDDPSDEALFPPEPEPTEATGDHEPEAPTPGSAVFPHERYLIQDVFQDLARVTTLVTDHPLLCKEVGAERREHHVAGHGGRHIAFKFAVDHEGSEHEGCLLIPLADALSLATAYMMRPPEDIAASRDLDAPDSPRKRALLSLSVLMAQTIDRELHRTFGDRARARCIGCQGVRAGVPPSLQRPAGTKVLVGRAEASFATFEPFELIMMLPTFYGVRN